MRSTCLAVVLIQEAVMSFRLVPKSVTLNDLKRRNGHYCALSYRIWQSCQALSCSWSWRFLDIAHTQAYFKIPKKRQTYTSFNKLDDRQASTAHEVLNFSICYRISTSLLYNKNSSGDEIANVNFLRRYGTYVLQNTKKENLLRLTNQTKASQVLRIQS